MDMETLNDNKDVDYEPKSKMEKPSDHGTTNAAEVCDQKTSDYVDDTNNAGAQNLEEKPTQCVVENKSPACSLSAAPEEDATKDNQLSSSKSNVKSDNQAAEGAHAKPEDKKKETVELFVDNIGDTVYSKRFVLDTLLKLQKISKPLSEEEAFEKALCSVWDMTTDENVVKFILENDAVDIFVHIIGHSEDMRLKEILIGILANMCHQTTACLKVKESSTALHTLFDTLYSHDTESLIQLMRFIAVFFANWSIKFKKDELEDHLEDIPALLKYIVFILSGSTSVELLQNTLIALDIFMKYLEEFNEQFMFKIFTDEDLLLGTIVAFETLFAKKESDQSGEAGSDNDDDNLDEEASRGNGSNNGFQMNLIDEPVFKKAAESFTDIHVTLVLLDSEMDNITYTPLQRPLLSSLEPLIKYLAVKENYMANQLFTQKIFDDIKIMLLNLKNPFEEKIIKHFFKIYDKCVKENETEYFPVITMILGTLLSSADPEELNHLKSIYDPAIIQCILDSIKK